MNIPIVVVAYNRPASLERLLKSLDKAYYSHKVALIISIDKSDNDEVRQLAEGFDWKYGEKQIIVRKQHLGLKEHVLTCGDLALDYDGIIMLEDDLFVSPAFYSYSLDAINYYKDDHTISGISLYSHMHNETAYLPFTPLVENADVFFMQVPSSWGQCYTQLQWKAFKLWYNNNKSNSFSTESLLPKNAVKWHSSWKKYFFRFMIEHNKFFVYPRHSLSTNFADPGVHFDRKHSLLQVPIVTEPRPFVFKQLSEANAVYDSHCEILPNRLIRMADFLGAFSFDVDLYGTKETHHCTAPYILTTRLCKNPVFSFSMELIPMELNITNQIIGKDFYLASVKDCDFTIYTAQLEESKLFHFYKIPAYLLNTLAETSENMEAKNRLIDEYKKRSDQKDAVLIRQTNAILQKDLVLEERNAIVEQSRQKINENEKILNEHLQVIRNKDLELKQRDINMRNLLAESAKKNLELKKQSETVKQLQADNSGKEVKLKTLASQIQQMESVKASLESSLAVKASEIHYLTELKALLENTLKNSTSEIARLDVINAEFMRQLKSNQAELIDLRNDVTSIAEKLQKSEAMANGLQDENSLLSNKLGETEVLADRFKQSAMAKDRQIAELKVLIRNIETSYTFRVGKTMIWPASKIKHFLKRK